MKFDATHSLFCAILNRDQNQLRSLLKQKIDCNSLNQAGQTPLDYALFHHNQEAVRLLRAHGGLSRLSAKEMLDLENHVIANEEKSYSQIEFVVKKTKQGPVIEITEKNQTGYLIHHLKFNPWQQSAPKESLRWKLLVKGQSCLVYLVNQSSQEKPEALYEVHRDGKLSLHFAHQPNTAVSVRSDFDFEVKTAVIIQKLKVEASDFKTSSETKLVKGEILDLYLKNAHLASPLSFKSANLKIENIFDQIGEMSVSNLVLKATEIKQTGKMHIADHYAVEATGVFNNNGEWISEQAGKIQAHAVILGSKSILVSQKAEIEIFARSNIENSGGILAKFVSLEAGLQINHTYGALLKGLSCQIHAPQLNISGFVLEGHKNTLSCIDWAFNIVHAGVNLAQLGSYLPLPGAIQLRSYLLVAKSLYCGADLLYKIAQGKSNEISKWELVTFFLDNVVPSLGALSSEQEKAQLFVNVLYHFYHSFISEEKFVQRSLNFVEALTRALPLAAGELPWLKKAAEMIRYTRYALKLADISGEALLAWQSADAKAFDNTMITLQTMAEGVFREILYALSPSQLLESNLLINSRDIVLFILNKGHHSDLLVQSILYGALHVAKNSGLLNEQNGYLELQTGLQFFFKTKAWSNIYQAYQAGTLTRTQVITEAIQSLIIMLSYSAQKYPHAKIAPKEIPMAAKPVADIPEEVKATAEVKVAISRGRMGRADRDFARKHRWQTHQKALKEHYIPVPEYKKEVLTLDVPSIIESNLLHNSEIVPEVNNLRLACDILLELQRAFSGEYGANGHLAAFVGTLHQEGVLESTGNMSIYATGVTNNNVMRAGKNIGLFGAHLANTFFKNLHSGAMTAQEAVYGTCLDLLENQGLIFALNTIKVTAARIVKNYKEGQFIAKEDIDLLAESLAENAGFISGKNVNFSGKNQKALNAGVIKAERQINLMSQKLVALSKEGYFISERVSLNSAKVVKEGSIDARLVQTSGYKTQMPDEITWKRGERDAISGLVLKAKQPLEVTKDAFNQVKLTDLTLDEVQLTGERAFEIDSSFGNTLQIHLPHAKNKIPLAKLPHLSGEATLIVEAPKSILDLENNADNPYPNTLRFIGEQADYSNKQAHFLHPLLLDVDEIVGEGARSALTLQKGGFLQAKAFKNQGKVHADDAINWNVRCFDNEALLTSYKEHFQHSLRLPVLQECLSTKVEANSGEVYALGHNGYLGKINFKGGKFLSGNKGTYVFYEGGRAEAVLTEQGTKTSTVLHDAGQNWYLKPTWVNAEIGSTGRNCFIGSKAMVTAGLDFWGRKGAYLNSEKELFNNTKSKSYAIPQVLSLKKNNRVESVIQPHTLTSAVTQNHISSDEGVITLVARNGDIKLENTILSAAGNINLIAKNQVSINGVQVSHQENIHFRNRGLLNNNSFRSVTNESRVQSSYIFTGGELVVRADEFALGAVQGVLAGADIAARKTTFKGKEQTLDNKTVIKQFKLEVPGINNITDVLHGQNGKAVFKSFINACGWEPHELEDLLHADSVAELPMPLLNISRNAWNLSAFVAHACQEYGESPDAFVGTITDQLGITTSKNGKDRAFNTNFTFNLKKTTKEKYTSQMISTNLYVGGTFRLVGEELQILDGSSVDAAHLRIFLTEGIKATKGRDYTRSKEKSKGGSLGINASDLQDVSVGLTHGSTTHETENVHLAKLHARDSAIIEGGKSLAGDLRITSPNGGKVSAARMDFNTPQDKILSISKSSDVHASANYTAGGHFSSDTTTRQYTSEKAGVVLPNGQIAADNIHLGNGSKIETEKLSRLDGQAGLPSVTGTSAVDIEREKRMGFSSQISRQGSSSVSVEKHTRDKVTIHRPTVLAHNVTAQSLPGINTLAANETEVEREKRGGFALTAFQPDFGKMSKEAKEIKEVAKKSMRWVFDEIKKVPESLLKSIESPSPEMKDTFKLPIMPSNDVRFVPATAHDVPVSKQAVPKGQAPRKQRAIVAAVVPTSLEPVPAASDTLPIVRKDKKKAEKQNWFKMAWRAFKGEQSPEVSTWQAQNKEAVPPSVIGFVDAVEAQRQAMNAPLVWFKKSLKEPVDMRLQKTKSALESPDLSGTERIGLEVEKRVLQKASKDIDKYVPGSFEELTTAIILKTTKGIVKNTSIKWASKSAKDHKGREGRMAREDLAVKAKAASK